MNESPTCQGVCHELKESVEELTIAIESLNTTLLMNSIDSTLSTLSGSSATSGSRTSADIKKRIEDLEQKLR